MYQPPRREMAFVMHELLDDGALAAGYAGVGYDAGLADGIVEEAARFASEVFLPLNAPGDREGAHWSEQGVTMPAGFVEAYREYVAAGWPQLSIAVEHGGQGMPQLLNIAVEELMFSANMALYLGPSLARGAVEAMLAASAPGQLDAVLPRLASGEWMGTMGLTEPQAGSDLALVRTRAVADGDHYRLFGQKIFITYGEHDLSPNIVHLVLARIDGAPQGTRGISLFRVPRYLPGPDGEPGEANDVRCLSIEHKLGIHASPTCVMAFGEKQGAVGHLLGEPGRGLAYMFVMMNAARLSVGVQGVAQAERALQQALQWARTRRQGRRAGDDGPVPIIEHPDVRRMLLSMRARTEAMRALVYYTALALDHGRTLADEVAREASLHRAELLVPVAKAWCTDGAVEVASIGIQVHGGMGYIEETGAAQFLRDARITPIYEGTNGIQANDLVGRKLRRDGGAAMMALLRDLRGELAGGAPTALHEAALQALQQLQEATQSLLAQQAADEDRALAVAVPYLDLCGLAVGGALMVRSAQQAAAALVRQPQEPFYLAKQQTARFYAMHLLPQAAALARIVTAGAEAVLQAREALL